MYTLYNFTATHTHTHTHTQSASASESNVLSTETNNTTEHVFSYSWKKKKKNSSEMFWRTEWYHFPDASKQGIPEKGSNTPEGSLTVSLCLRISRPRNIKERSWRWSERAREGVEMQDFRGVERRVSMNWQVCSTKISWWMRSWTGRE